jgi:hypothetical protein
MGISFLNGYFFVNWARQVLQSRAFFPVQAAFARHFPNVGNRLESQRHMKAWMHMPAGHRPKNPG